MASNVIMPTSRRDRVHSLTDTRNKCYLTLFDKGNLRVVSVSTLKAHSYGSESTSNFSGNRNQHTCILVLTIVMIG